MPRKSSALDVARDAGVSLSTVDRVLNNRGGVAKEKEKRVLAAARRLRLDRALDLRDARTLRIAVLIQPPSNPFHALLQAAVEAENRGPDPFNMQLRIFHIDPARPDRIAAQIRDVAGGHDGLVVCVAHSEAVANALGATVALGKPVITLATEINLDAAHTYVGPDNHRAGRVAGDLMGRILAPDGGEILVVCGMLSMTGQTEREAGFRAVLAERYPACHVVEVAESKENGDWAGELAFRALGRFPGLRGIYNASAGAQPLVDAIARRGRTGQVAFITHELTPERRGLLKAGLIDAIIDQAPALEMRTATEAMAVHFGRLAAGPTDAFTPVHIHTIETC